MEPRAPAPPYSYSQLAALDCPRQYFFQYVLRAPQPAREYFERGRLTHETIERAMRAAFQPDSEDLSRAEGSWDAAKYRAAAEEQIILAPREVKGMPFDSDAYRVAVANVGNWIARHTSNGIFAGNPRWEQPFGLQERDGKLIPFVGWNGDRSCRPLGLLFRGYIDFALLRGRPLIIDWKTGGTARKPREKGLSSMQLACYALALFRLLPQVPVIDTTYFNCRLADEPETPYPITAAEASETAERWILDRAAAIASRDWQDASAWEAEKTEYCWTCPWREGCPAHMRGSKGRGDAAPEETFTAVLSGKLRHGDWGDRGIWEFDLSTTDRQKRDTLKVTGTLVAPLLGGTYRLVGSYQDRGYGREFKASAIIPIEAADAAACRRILDSVKWIGPKRAELLANAYGADALKKLCDDPAAAAKTAKIPLKQAKDAAEMLRKNLGEAEAKAALFKLLPSVHGGVVNRLWDAHGASAVAVIRENPYSATRCHGIGWLTADALAGSLGITGDDRRRVRAGIDEALRFAELSGHTGLPSSEFSGAATRLLGEDCVGAIKEIANELLAAGELRAEVGFADGSRLIQRSAQADLEIEIAEQLAALRAAVDVSEARNWVPEISPETTIPEAMSRLSEEQFAAVGFILSEGIGIITGGPGTGKTYCLQSLIECAPLARWLLVAPTGKAARVMADRVGREAKTIHSALEPDPVGTDMDKGQWKFKRDAKRPFDADIIVCDEASMIDHALAHAFLAAIPRGAWLVILGDADQLPSVGAGDFLRSICDTEILPVHRLTEIHRAAAASRGVAACHAIIKGQSPIPCRTDSGPATPAERNFWLIKCPAEQIPAMAGKLVGEWGPAHGIDTADAVCLSANSAKRGAVCAPALNAHLQEVVNPGGKPITQIDPRAEVPWRIGDRLVQTRNDYATGLVNGELVTLVRADNFGGNPIIRTDDGREIAVKGDADGIALQLAHALTVHKFQGSEARLVIVCLDWNSQRMVVNRNWLYTALSRFRDFVFVLTPRPQDVAKTIEKPGDARYTGLAARMACHADSAQKRKALADYEDCMIPF